MHHFARVMTIAGQLLEKDGVMLIEIAVDCAEDIGQVGAGVAAAQVQQPFALHGLDFIFDASHRKDQLNTALQTGEGFNHNLR